MTNVASQLKRIPLFADLKGKDLKAVAELVKRTQHPAGSEICRQGRPGRAAYFVESGELLVIHVNPQGVRREVNRLGPGSFFGETSLMLGEPRDATIQAAQDTTLLSLSKGDLDQLLHERPEVFKALNMSPEVERKRHARHFKWQDPDEIVIVHLRKHRWVLIRNVALPVFVLLVDLVGCGWWYSLSGGVMALTVGVLLGLIPLAFISYLYLDYANDNYVVTNKRVVHEERILIFQESRVEAPLRAVQDIQESQEGLLAQWFDFGDLIIETAGERGHVVFREIPDPDGTRNAIFEQIQRAKAGARAQELATIRDMMRRHFGMPSPEDQVAAPAEAPRKRWFQLKPPAWLLASLRIFTYFLPPLRHEQGDTITWRKHWIALIEPIWLPTLLIIAITVFTVFAIGRSDDSRMPVLIGYSTALVFLFPWWLWQFDDWQNDTYQVTATRIIDVERLPFYLREDRREASLGVIQNIKLDIPGFLAKLLNYGSVTVETAGIGAFTFDRVKDPRSVQAEIFRRVEAFQSQQRREEAERHQAELLDWFSVYDQVRHSATPPPQVTSLQQQES